MLDFWQILVRIGLAAVAGGAIGLDREHLHWAAGLRTHMLVCVGSCLFVIVSAFGFADALHPPLTRLDPSRIAAQVVSGVGFLGAGTIMLRGDVIRGLTTAASLWTVAAVGLAIGCGLYVAALIAAVVVLVTLKVLKPLETYFARQTRPPKLTIATSGGRLSLAAVQAKLGSDVEHLVAFRRVEAGEAHAVEITFDIDSAQLLRKVAADIETIPSVLEVRHG